MECLPFPDGMLLHSAAVPRRERIHAQFIAKPYCTFRPSCARGFAPGSVMTASSPLRLDSEAARRRRTRAATRLGHDDIHPKRRQQLAAYLDGKNLGLLKVNFLVADLAVVEIARSCRPALVDDAVRTHHPSIEPVPYHQAEPVVDREELCWRFATIRAPQRRWSGSDSILDRVEAQPVRCCRRRAVHQAFHSRNVLHTALEREPCRTFR